MKRIKPGRGPSMLGAAGSIFASVFGIFWTILALSMGAPWFFGVFGIIFIITAVVQGLYHYKNATGKERFSTFDIVDDEEEGDPLDQWSRDEEHADARDSSVDRESVAACGNDTEVNFCPYCGAKAEKDFLFCQKCGKKIR